MGSIFKQAEKYLDPDVKGAIVEIGSDRYEGSTQYFAALAKDRGVKFHTVDIVEDAHARLKYQPGMESVNWHVAQGSEWAETLWPRIGNKISCLYLDNFDYDWDANRPNEDIQKQRNWYKENFGVDMFNQNCQVEHLRQMIALLPHMTQKCTVICDDTYMHNDCWIGKGGGVVLYLLAQKFNIMVKHRRPGDEYGVILTRG